MEHALVIGNWKMELSHKGELELARALKRQLKGSTGQVGVVVCPSFPSLAPVSELLATSAIDVGAQQVYWEETGAVTGAVSAGQIAPFARWCIVGHSETRQMTSATDDDVARQVDLLLQQGITPVVCLGETWAERQADQTVQKITAQIDSLLLKMTRSTVTKLVIAYEPIWAISTQQTSESAPESVEVSGIMLLMRKLVAEKFDTEAAQRLRLLYGGNVTPETAGAYASEPGVNGVLVGSASLSPGKFLAIIKAVADAR